MKDSDKDIDKAVVALSALPVAPACKPHQRKIKATANSVGVW